MNINLKLVISCFIIIIFQSCLKEIVPIQVEGDILEQEFKLPDIDKIILNMPAEVVIRKGTTQKIIVKAQEEILDVIDKNVFNDSWEIVIKEGRYKYKKVLIEITLLSIVEVYNDASGDIEVSGFDNQETTLKLTVDGSGDIDFEGTATRADLTIDGSGSINFNGAIDFAEIVVDGSGDYALFSADIKEAVMNVKGSGESEVNISEKLTVTFSGTGDVFYKGRPDITTYNNSTGTLIDAN